MLPGTNWTPYMLAVSQQNGALKENGQCRDNVAILDILTSIYADFNGDFDVLKFVTFSNTLEMTAMGKTYAQYLKIVKRTNLHLLQLTNRPPPGVLGRPSGR